MSLIFGKRLLVPASSYIESDVCKSIVDEHRPIFGYGVFDVTGSSPTFEDALGEAETLYQENPERLEKYRAFPLGEVPPYAQRAGSATQKLIERWNELARSSDPAKIFGVGDRTVQSAIERRWDHVTRELEGSAMIAENVSRHLFGASESVGAVHATKTLVVFLGDEYFSAVSKEFNSHVFSNVPYMANVLSFGQFQKLDYRQHLEIVGARLVSRIDSIDSNYLLEEVQTIRHMLFQEGTIREL